MRNSRLGLRDQNAIPISYPNFILPSPPPPPPSHTIRRNHPNKCWTCSPSSTTTLHISWSYSLNDWLAAFLHHLLIQDMTDASNTAHRIVIVLHTCCERSTGSPVKGIWCYVRIKVSGFDEGCRFRQVLLICENGSTW